MNRAICLAGANGDLLAMFPLLRHWADKGKKTRLIVSPTYSAICEGIKSSDIEVQVMDQPYTKSNPDMRIPERAMRLAQSEIPNARLIHLNPTIGDPRADKTSSFVPYMWNLCGALDQWDTLPLVLDRDRTREDILVRRCNPAGKPNILLALHGLSSPFGRRKLLTDMIKEQFPQFKIIDLSTVNAHQIYDLLGLFDQAHCLIAVDTAHLHLSTASNVPTVALAQDVPPWKGSPMASHHKLHVRYGDFEDRAGELIEAVDHAVYGTEPIKPVVLDLPGNGYNPSIVPWEDGYLCAYRVHPEKNFRTRLSMVELDKDLKIKRVARIDCPATTNALSCEDPRLFFHADKLWISYTVAVPQSRPPRCGVTYGELKQDSHGWHIVNDIRPQYGVNDMHHMEKNWVFFDNGVGGLRCFYNDSTVLSVIGKTITSEMHHTPYRWQWGAVHGGTNIVPHKSGAYLRFFHSRFMSNNRAVRHRYHLGAMLISPDNYEPIKISEYPIYSGEERLWPAVWHWKPNVIFPTSVFEHGDGRYKVAVGINDCRCGYMELTEEQLNL